MNPSMIITVVGIVAVMAVVAFVAYKKLPRKLKVDKFIVEWKELQGFCKDKKTWPDAILQADNLLDKALKKRKYKGKRMGERMVSAQRVITDNDRLWFAHNLAKKIMAEPKTRLKESDVKTALIGYRQALKDLGALPTADTVAANEEGAKK